MSITLIANSGIQFHKFELKINPNDEVIKTMGFYEYLDDKNERISLQYAYYLPDLDIWVPKKILREEENLDHNDNLNDNVNYNIIKNFALKEETEFYTISDISGILWERDDKEIKNIFQNVWLPVPYFKKNNNRKSVFGPIAWARMMLKDISDKNDRIKTYKVILSFDTATNDDSNIYFAPHNDDALDPNNYFGLSNNEDYNLNFCDSDYHCGWVDKYLKGVYYKRTAKNNSEFPYLKYLANYLYLIRYLEAMNVFPEVIFYSDNQSTIDVDLVLDIGNSNTCGLLFESPVKSASSFNFKSVKKLKINDLSEPEKDYHEPFSMRLAFVEAKFGEMDIPNHKNFRWPSLLRLGKEAGRLINIYNLDTDKGKETATNHSSPKRYLWDNRKADVQWEFINFRGKNLKDAIYYEGISEQFKENGEYAYDGNFSCTPYYSRKSLMTFVFVEIILHAISQINSHEFRFTHGHPEKPRKLKRITITCPTSIIQKEQVVLRECAVEAVRALGRFFSESFLGQYDDENEAKSDLEIIPKPKDLAKNLSLLSTRKDWIYDEATCSQLVFLYGEISQRYLNNAEVFFDLYGKKRDDVSSADRNALTIGSIDIGGGTTDLMICSYQYEKGQGQAVIKPHPLYWESFNLAGDDLLKEIVQQIVLEGASNKMDDQGCFGVIENNAREKGVADVVRKMQNFFGPDSNRQGYMARIYRKNFIIQVAIPIALRYLQHAMENKPDLKVGFKELFTDMKPNPELLDYFNRHFYPLKFEEIEWKLSKKRVFSIVETTFDPLLKQLSAIMSAYGCDFVLLAGKPTTIPKIREMFIKYYPVSPERIVTLNHYRVGRWYPFADDIGYFEDPKTIVSVGALIALMGGSIDKLEGFRLNTQLLKRKLISTADYIGVLNKSTQNIDLIFVSPDENTCEIEIHSLPMVLGYKQLPNRNYRGRPIYKLDFNDEQLKEKVLEQNSLLENEREISNATEDYKKNLKMRMPFSVKIKREWSASKEALSIEVVKDVNRNETSKRFLKLSVMTLPDEEGYWLDTGEFILNIK